MHKDRLIDILSQRDITYKLFIMLESGKSRTYQLEIDDISTEKDICFIPRYIISADKLGNISDNDKGLNQLKQHPRF